MGMAGQSEDGQVFPEAWMNRCYKDLVYPNPACVQVMEKVNKSLARYVTKPLGSEFKQQALFSLLGPEFTTQYFPYQKYDLKKLDCGYPDDVANYQKDDELGRFLQEVRNSFHEGLRTRTAVVMFHEETEKERQKRNEDDDYEDDMQRAKKKALKAQPRTKPSDVAGNALMAFLAYDGTKKSDFIKRLRERRLALPNNLRQYFWWEFLVEREAAKLKVKSGQDARALMKENFETTLTKEMKSQNVERAVRSNNWQTIDGGVIEAYDTNPTLKSLSNHEHMMQSARALNLFIISSKIFSVANIYWLLPIQQIFQKGPNDSDESHMVHLAMVLELLTRHCQLQQKDVFTLAEEVMKTVKANDPQYSGYITTCLNNSASRINLKDFPPEVLIQGTKASVKQYQELQEQGSNDMKPKHLALFTNPGIFVRKWIAQGFVGVVSITSGLWVWDQLFLDGWNKTTMRNMAVAILILIKPWMMRANTYADARKVLLNEPGKLYLSDLRRALEHLESGGAYADFPDNKNFLEPIVPKAKYNDESPAPIREQVMRKTEPPKTEELKPNVVPYVAPFRLLREGRAAPLPVDPEPLDAPAGTNDQPPAASEPLPDDDSDDDSTDDTPPPTASPPSDNLGWVPYDQTTTEPNLPTPTRPNKPFDFYIDSVRFLPDNVTHCKVIGKVFNMSKDKSVPDIVTYAQFESTARCPTFRCKTRFNDDRASINPNMLIQLRVYGYQDHLQNVAIVGSSLLQVFDTSKTSPSLCVGGVQLRLRHGLPDTPQGLEKIAVTIIDKRKPIPGASICVRLLPASQETVKAPAYESGYYRSDECSPNDTDRQLFRYYIDMEGYMSITVKEKLKEAQKESGKPVSTTDDKLQRYMVESLDEKAQEKKSNQPTPFLDYTHFVNYDIDDGLKADVLSVFSLPSRLEGYYCQVFCQVLPGEEVEELPPTPEGYGHDQHFISKNLDFKSSQRSPVWLDDPVTLHPHYDEQSILLIQLFGFKPKYQPGNGSSPGILTTTDDRKVSFDYDTPLAWTFTQIFDKEAVLCGLHWLPLFTGSPDPLILDLLNETAPAHQVLSQYKSALKPLDGASIEIKLCDGRIDPLDIKEVRLENIMDVMGQRTNCAKGQIQTFSKTINELYLESMTKAAKKKGSVAKDTNKEREFFVQAANKAFFNAMNNALQEAGFTTLPEDS
ncbi:uncharacterized protein [Procambarus clarkii]|uniref:uncharacterized protein isoform X2 n=1 Tax=Procambarus clarkii TaxID=6728 RepID=UPI00374417D6